MRRLLWLAMFALVFVSGVAQAADESDGCKALALELGKPLPGSLPELDAHKARLSELKPGCNDDMVSRRANDRLVRIEIGKGAAMGATVAAAAGAAPAKAAPNKAVAATPPTQPAQRSQATPKPTPRPTPAPAPAKPKVEPPTKASIQARIALDAAKKAWEEARRELLAERDEKRRRELLGYYVSAAATYIEALLLFAQPTTADYLEVLAPLVGNGEAQSTLALSINRTRLEKLLEDQATVKGLREYVETTVRLGRGASPEQAKALTEAAASGFSKEGLDQLVSAWGQQQAQGLAYELEQLASIGEQLAKRPAEGEKPRLVLVVASTAPDVKCAAEAELLRHFGSLLQAIYGPKLTYQPLLPVAGETIVAFSDRIKTQLANADCRQCDGALGVLTTPEGNNLRVEVAFVPPKGSRSNASVKRARVVACAETGSGSLAASGMFHDLLSDRALVHDKHAELFTAPPPIRLDPGTIPTVSFACGSAERLPPKNPNRRGVAIEGKCKPETTRELSDVLGRQGNMVLIKDRAPQDLVATLREDKGKCHAAVGDASGVYANFWAETRDPGGPQPADVRSAEAHNTAAGDRLALCLSGYYFKVRGSEVPRGPSTRDEQKGARWPQALLAPGLPLLKDDNPKNDWGGYTWLIADGASVLGTVGFAGASIAARNYAAKEPSNGLRTANTLLALSFVSGAAVIVSRVVSVAVLGREPEPTGVGFLEPALLRF